MRVLSWMLMGSLLALGACKSGEPADEPGDATAPVADADKPVPDKIDVGGLDLKHKATVFVLPAPSEIVAMIEEIDDSGKLSASIGDVLPTYEGRERWQAALMLGATTGDLLVVVPNASDEMLLARLDNIAEGMQMLGSTDAQIADLSELRGKVAAGSITREKLIGELDLLRTAMLVDGKEQYGERDVMLIAVGGWARAVNLFATIAETSETVPEGSEVLKLRIVLDTLIDGVGPDEEVKGVADALKRLLPVATVTGRPDAPPSTEDLALLKEATGEILALTDLGR
jgi:hypothetical protein